MSKELCIEANWDIRWVWITDRDCFEKIVVEINDEIFSILSDEKTSIQEVKKIINDILTSKINYE